MVTKGGFPTIDDANTNRLIKPDGSLVTLGDIGLDGDKDGPKLVFLPMAIPIPHGYPLPIGLKFDEDLPPSDVEYPPWILAWLDVVKILKAINKGVPVTGLVPSGDMLFGLDQFHESAADVEENNYNRIVNATGEMLSKDTYVLHPSAVLPGSDFHSQHFKEAEHISRRALSDFAQCTPTKAVQPNPTTATNLAGYSKMLSDAFKKSNKSTDAKKIGFSNKVEEKLKLFGASIGVNKFDEVILVPATLTETCKCIYTDENKTSSTRCFQNAMRSEAVAMTDEGGNIAADNLIFNEHQFNPVYLIKLKFETLWEHLLHTAVWISTT